MLLLIMWYCKVLSHALYLSYITQVHLFLIFIRFLFFYFLILFILDVFRTERPGIMRHTQRILPSCSRTHLLSLNLDNIVLWLGYLPHVILRSSSRSCFRITQNFSVSYFLKLQSLFWITIFDILRKWSYHFGTLVKFAIELITVSIISSFRTTRTLHLGFWHILTFHF
jgi:hypothetical protein